MRGMGFLTLLTLLLIRLSGEGLLAEQVFSSFIGGTFSRSNREPKYRIEFHSSASPYSPEGDQESLMITDTQGKKILCFLPKVVESAKSVSQKNTSHMLVEYDGKANQKMPDELLEVMQDRCFLRQEGWWAYEFCYHKQLRQFHVNDDNKVVQEFILGRFDPEATAAYNRDLSDVSTLKDPRSKDATQKYHAHQYTNGTICDITEHPRETEVRFVCSESHTVISSIKEISTCRYAITIQGPMLCKHPMFQEERPMWNTINCNEMHKDENRGVEMNDGGQDEQITMLTDAEMPVHYDPDSLQHKFSHVMEN